MLLLFEAGPTAPLPAAHLTQAQASQSFPPRTPTPERVGGGSVPSFTQATVQQLLLEAKCSPSDWQTDRASPLATLLLSPGVSCEAAKQARWSDLPPEAPGKHLTDMGSNNDTSRTSTSPWGCSCPALTSRSRMNHRESHL